ncbi:MAG TPA: TIGR03067 domain-containing protein [Gemmataceae bacterium]|nr:TIGR03067 domain-containing protein [Gemmataceae bacterium]
MNASLLLPVALSLAAPALKDRPKKESSIVGEWKAEQIIAGGKPARAQSSDVRWVFAPDGTRVISRDGKQAQTGTFEADPKAKPATLDLDKGPAGDPRYLCIYKIEGDTLTLNVGWPKADRPTEFASPAGAQCTLYVFRRVKAKD